MDRSSAGYEMAEMAVWMNGNGVAHGRKDRARRVSPFVLWNVAAGFLVILAIQAGVGLLWKLQKLIVLVLVATFFAVVLGPVVDAVRRKLHLPRGLVIAAVFLTGLLITVVLSSLFLTPLVQAARNFAADAPQIVQQAQTDDGLVGEVLRRYEVDQWVSGNAPKLTDVLSNAGGPALRTLQRVLGGVALVMLLAVLTFMIMLEGPKAVDAVVSQLDGARAERVRRVGREVARALTGYVLGSLFTAAIAGTVMATTLYLLSVPYAFVFGVWVAMVTLLPQIGASSPPCPPPPSPPSSPAGRHNGAGRVRHLPVDREPPAEPAGDEPDGEAQPPVGAPRRADRRTARQHRRRPVRHPHRRGDPGRGARDLPRTEGRQGGGRRERHQRHRPRRGPDRGRRAAVVLATAVGRQAQLVITAGSVALTEAARLSPSQARSVDRSSAASAGVSMATAQRTHVRRPWAHTT
ncbi:MAG: AI-2E family transporter [Acidimicrobiales bacterium]